MTSRWFLIIPAQPAPISDIPVVPPSVIDLLPLGSINGNELLCNDSHLSVLLNYSGKLLWRGVRADAEWMHGTPIRDAADIAAAIMQVSSDRATDLESGNQIPVHKNSRSLRPIVPSFILGSL